MFCPKCGKELKAEWRVCPSCGNILHANSKNVRKKRSVQKKKRNLLKHGILLALFCIVIICIVIVLNFPNRGEQVIEYVKQYHAPDSYFDIAEALEIDGGDGIKWSYKKTRRSM